MERKDKGHGNYVLTVDGQQRPPTTNSKKKKNPKNPFYFYMQDFREAQETKRVFYNSQKEVAEAAAASWQYLSAEERKPYQDAAKEAKERDKLDLHHKFTAAGRSYAEVNKEEQELRENEEKMLYEIRTAIRSLRTSAALSNYPFYLIHVNYYCKTLSGLYVPCEIAISEFTLVDGVKKVFHVLINPGDLPLGYKYDAEKHSQETHKIPMPSEFQFDGVISHYASVYSCLHKFLNETKPEYKLCPLYTTASQLEPCKNVLAMLCDSVNKEEQFAVYPAKYMFYELQHACVDIFKPTDKSAVKLPFVSLAERELEKDIFDYTEGISCRFHEGTDAIPFCSFSCVQRWSFLILDYCHQVTKMPLIPGKHVPQHTKVSQFKTLTTVPQRKPDDMQKLNTTMQTLHVDSSRKPNHSGAQPPALDLGKPSGEQGAYARVLRTPKQLSEAINLLSPDDSDEFPPLGT